MPTQNTTIAEGLEDCEAVRISYSTAATPNAPILTDDESRYLLVERTEPTQALKIVLQYTPSTDPYDSYTASYRVTGSAESAEFDFSVYPRTWKIVTTPYDETFSNGSYGNGPYYRRVPRAVNESYPDGTYRNSARLGFFCAPVVVDDYDENGDPIQYTIEPPGFEIESSSQELTRQNIDNEDIYFSSSYSTQVLSLTTTDGRPIDIETAAVSDGWAIVVYEVYEWGDSELARFRFDVDPQATARCNNELCDNGCLEFVIDEGGAYTCICPEEYDLPELGPPRPEPDLGLEVPPKAAIHQKREPLKRKRRELAKVENEYRDTLGKIGQKEQAVSDAVAQGNLAAEATAKKELEELVDKGSKQADDYQNLKTDNDEDSAIEKGLVNAEKDLDITVVPAQDESRYPAFTQGTKYAQINNGITIRPTIIGVTIEPEIVGTTISSTINRGVTISQTVNGRNYQNTVNGIRIGDALPTSDSDGIDL